MVMVFNASYISYVVAVSFIVEDGAKPSERLRKLEQEANRSFDQFREM
jgi:hypothetical protein